MKNLAAHVDDELVFQTMGTIARVEGPVLVVQTDRGDLRARRAVSCLVEPALHDFVLVGGQSKTCYILAVLERESPDVRVVSDGALDLQAETRCTVVAPEGVDVVTPKAVNLTGAEVGIHASRAKVFASEIVAIGSEVLGELTHVKLRGTFLDKVFERVSERVQRSFRRVEELEQLRAKQVDYSAEETLCLRSENMVAVAKELVKVDGEQIHFG